MAAVVLRATKRLQLRLGRFASQDGVGLRVYERLDCFGFASQRLDHQIQQPVRHIHAGRAGVNFLSEGSSEIREGSTVHRERPR